MKIRKKKWNIFETAEFKKRKKNQYNSTCSFLYITLPLRLVMSSIFQLYGILHIQMIWEYILGTNWILIAGWPLHKQWSGKEWLPLRTKEAQFNQKHLGIHCIIIVQLNMVWDHCQMPCTCCHLPTSLRCYLVLTINLFK